MWIIASRQNISKGHSIYGSLGHLLETEDDNDDVSGPASATTSGRRLIDIDSKEPSTVNLLSSDDDQDDANPNSNKKKKRRCHSAQKQKKQHLQQTDVELPSMCKGKDTATNWTCLNPLPRESR